MNPMVLSGIPLPLELVSMIFSLLSRYDLIACSTVAQSWRYHAQNRIFREYSIEIDHKCERQLSDQDSANDSDDMDTVDGADTSDDSDKCPIGPCTPSFEKFLSFLTHHRHIGGYIKELRLFGPFCMRDGFDVKYLSRSCTLDVFHGILSMLPNLKHLRLGYFLFPIDTDYLPTDKTLFDLDSLSISIPYCECSYEAESADESDEMLRTTDLLKLLSPFRHLGQLHLDCTFFNDRQEELDEIKSNLPPLPRLTVDNLMVENGREMLPLLYVFIQGETLSQLSTLSFFVLPFFLDEPSLQEMLGDLIQLVGPHLKSFRCNLRDVAEFEPDSKPFSVFLGIMRRSSWDQLEELTLDTNVTDPGTDALKYWSHLPVLLSAVTFPKLKRVTLGISCSRKFAPTDCQTWDLSMLENTLLAYPDSIRVSFIDALSGDEFPDFLKSLLRRLAAQSRLEFPATSDLDGKPKRRTIY